MAAVSWMPVRQSLIGADTSIGEEEADRDVSQSIDASLSLLGWCGAGLTALVLIWLALNSSPYWAATELPICCPSAMSVSASVNIALLHHQVLRKLHSTPAQPLTIGVVGGSVSRGGGGGANATYAAQFVDYLNSAYPVATNTSKPQLHALVNRALSGSSSSAVTLCQETHFGGVGHVDLLLFEYAVNDPIAPYRRVPSDELNMHSSANIERIIRFWLMRGTAVWLIEVPGRVGLPDGVRNQGNLFSPIAEYYGVPNIDSSGLYTPIPHNRYWKELFVDQVHPKQQTSALTTALMVRELRFHERILQKAKVAKLGFGVRNGALLVPNGPHSRSALQAEARLPSSKDDVRPSVMDAEVYPWHGLDVHEAARSSPLMLCVHYETELRAPALAGLVLDDYHGKCYYNDYGTAGVKMNKLYMRNTSSAHWDYGPNPDRLPTELGFKVGFFTKTVNASLAFDLGNVRRLVGLLHLDTWAPCGAAALWLTYRSPSNDTEQRWPTQPVVLNCTSDTKASTSKVFVIQHVDALRDSLRLTANETLPMQLHVLNLYHEDARNQSRATFFMMYGYIVD